MSVVDGDTMKIEYRDGERDTIRLLGVDTPEVHVEPDPGEFEGIPENGDGRQWLRSWGENASQFATNRLAGEEVRIAVDEQADRRGSYGRLLVYAYVDGESFNRQLLDRGYARLYESDFSERDAYAAVEAAARDDGVGVWGYEAGTTTTTTSESEGGDGSGTLTVATVHADAPGNDHDNLNEEYVAFENGGQSTIDVSGWTISDAADHEYTVPGGVTLDPGETITLYTGSGSDTESKLYWGSERAVWNNGGDTILVTDEDGETALRHEYEG